MRTPVAFIIFNRPDLTERVFAEIAKAKPSKLYVIADGPRTDHPDDIDKCAAARRIIDRVDWECEVFKNYSDVNLGCGYRPATGISWVFDHEEEAIILEDDCVPHPTFFRFCEELLERYRYDERIMQISGFNSLAGRHHIRYSYSFYRIFACWGWATWRRAWQYFDMEMKLWPLLRDSSWLRNILAEPGTEKHWYNIFDKAYRNSANIDFWDYQFLFAVWAQNGLAIFPRCSLVFNIGFRGDASHTKSSDSPCARVPMAEMKFPLKHPPFIVWDRDADLLHLRQMNEGQWPVTLRRRLRKKLSCVRQSLRLILTPIRL